MDKNAAIHAAWQGDAVLFIGAGWSVGATNLKDSSPKTGRQLAEFLAARLGLQATTPLEDAAELFTERFGKDELIKELKREYSTKDVTPTHSALALVPWVRVYTTNYDNVFEVAATRNRVAVTPITLDADIASIPKADRLCIHLNGFIDRLDRNNLFSSFKLTDTSYATASLETSSWITLFRQDLAYARAVFFVGYSLFDLDIKRLLRASDGLSEKCFFIFDAQVDQVTLARAKRFGHPVLEGKDAFAIQVRDLRNHASSQKAELQIGRSISEQSKSTSPMQIQDKHFLDLLLWGKLEPQLFQPSIDGTVRYLCVRPQVAQILDTIETNSQFVAIHSDIANGKSTLCELVAISAIQKGWRVFKAHTLNDWTLREMRGIASIEGKVLLVVENYSEWISEIRNGVVIVPDRFRFLVTARSTNHDFFVDDLNEIADGSVAEFNLNVLTDQEIVWWMDSLTAYGLWGPDAAQSIHQKTRIIRDTCRSQIHAVLLRLLSSPDIAQRLSAIAQSFKVDHDTERLMVSVFVLTLLGHRPTLDLLTDLLGTGVLNEELRRNDSGIHEFVDFGRSEISVRSPIAAEYLLRHFWLAPSIVTILVELAKAAERNSRVSRECELVFKNIMRFSSLQLLLPETGRNAAVISFFEQLKDLRRCRRNPLFWLQYAIGALVIDDLPRAERYFDTAYSYADDADFDTFQIDNHFARLLLVRASEDAPFKESIDYFRKARTIINRQIRDERRHYPYRVATGYQSFFDRFASQFSIEQLRELQEACITIRSRIAELPGDRGLHKYVRKCAESMEYVIARVQERIETLAQVNPD